MLSMLRLQRSFSSSGALFRENEVLRLSWLLSALVGGFIAAALGEGLARRPQELRSLWDLPPHLFLNRLRTFVVAIGCPDLDTRAAG
jgi:hypothetical protein